jgi:predicted nucleic-acid-binding protein
MLESLVKLRSVKIDKKRRLLRAFELYENTNLDFVDCLLAAYVEYLPGSTLYSFDENYRKKVPHISWRAP